MHSDKEVRNTGLVHSSDGGIWNGCDARRKEDRYSLSRVFLGYERRHKRGVQQAISPSYPASCPYAPSVTHFVPSVVTRGTQRRRGGTIIRTGNGWQVESYWIRNFTTFKMTLHLNKLYPFFLDSHSFTSIARASLLSWMMNGRYEWMSVKRTRLVNVGGACFLSFLSLSLHSLHSWHMKGVERNVRDWHERNVEASVGSDIKNERNWKWEFI